MSLREVSDRLYFKRPVRLVSSASVSPLNPPPPKKKKMAGGGKRQG